jgi:hypothetical protein
VRKILRCELWLCYKPVCCFCCLINPKWVVKQRQFLKQRTRYWSWNTCAAVGTA